MPAKISVTAMCQLLAKSRLMCADDAKSLHQSWIKEARQPDDADQFRIFLVKQGHATDYQAALLAHGRTEGYFIGRYKILERIGQGRMAGVYRAEVDGKQVAIKVLPPSKAREPQLLARFQREAKLSDQLQHPNVVRTLDCGESGNLQYIVMEYLEGETLDDILQRRKKLALGEAVRLLHQAFLGLQHIHEQGMIHRDLKPANLMLVPESRQRFEDTTLRSNVKILDIGLGRALFDERASVDDVDTQLTGEGVLLGTPDYLAPEQARDAHAADIRSDIYSLGCVLYHTLTGQPPFPDSNMLSQIVRHATEPPRPLSEFDPAIPDGLQQIVKFLLAKDPGQRYPTPGKVASVLQMFLPAEEPGVTLENIPAVKPSDPKPPNPPPAQQPGEIPMGKLVSTGAKAEKPIRKEKPKPVEVPATVAVPHPPPPVTVPMAAAPIVPLQTPPALTVGEYDVELVAVPFPPAVIPRKPGTSRSLLDMDRRDFIMLGGGVIGTIIAILAAVGLFKLVNRKPPENKSEGEK